MRLNFLAYQYRDHDGYGRYSNRLIRAIQRRGVSVAPLLAEMTAAPQWMHLQLGIDWTLPALSCLPPFYLRSTPGVEYYNPPSPMGAHWLLTMTEGDRLPAGWADLINDSNVVRVIVPCQHNADVFYAGGVLAPITVLGGGTDPDEFPLITEWPARPTTFLALADRGSRKGWPEVWQAFYQAFGTPADTPDVRLILKARPGGNDLIEMMARADNRDPRIEFILADMDPAELYRLADCFVIPSRSEGWGMPHREAAMMGIPVITQAYAGVDDGHTSQWAIAVPGGTLEPIPGAFEHIAGQWLRADVGAVAAAMRAVYDEPASYRAKGRRAAMWLRKNQTWDHTAAALLSLMTGAPWR